MKLIESELDEGGRGTKARQRHFARQPECTRLLLLMMFSAPLIEAAAGYTHQLNAGAEVRNRLRGETLIAFRTRIQISFN